MQPRPTLSSSCARAATAAEARFRISYPDMASRASRVIALDEPAAELVRELAGQPWHGGRFLVFDRLTPAGNGHGPAADAVLQLADGSPTLLSSELDGADVAVMIATPAARAEVASVIGDACASRWVMSAGLVVAGGAVAGGAVAGHAAAGHAAAGDAVAGDAVAGNAPAEAVVAALRPNAMVLVVLRSSDDVAGILSALRV